MNKRKNLAINQCWKRQKQKWKSSQIDENISITNLSQQIKKIDQFLVNKNMLEIFKKEVFSECAKIVKRIYFV